MPRFRYSDDDRIEPRYPGTPMPSTQPPLQGAGADRIRDFYRTLLGREGSDEEVRSHLGGGRFANDAAFAERARQTFSQGPEYQARLANMVPGPPVKEGTALPPGSSPPTDLNTTNPGGNYNRPPLTPGTFPSTLPQRGNYTLGGYPDQLGRSMKHVAGAILSRYPHNAQGLVQAMNDPEWKQWFPNATLVDPDEVDFGGQLSDFDEGVPVGLVDLIKAQEGEAGGEMWQWLDQNFMGDAGGPPTGGGDPAARLSGLPGGNAILEALLAGADDSDLWLRIQEELKRLLTGQGATPVGI